MSGTISAFGAFIARSNSVSGIRFGLCPFEAGRQISAPNSFVGDAHPIGGATGDRVVFHNAVAASAVVAVATGLVPFLLDSVVVSGIY